MNYWQLGEIYLLSLVKACGIEGKQVKCPGSLPLLGNVLVRALLQQGDGDKVLGLLPLVTGQEVVRHHAQIPTIFVMGLVITPSQTHWLQVEIGCGGHPYIVGSVTLWSA